MTVNTKCNLPDDIWTESMNLINDGIYSLEKAVKCLETHERSMSTENRIFLTEIRQFVRHITKA